MPTQAPPKSQEYQQVLQHAFIHRRLPLEHVRIERLHQTIAGQAFEGQIFDDETAFQRSLQTRILFLKQEYPIRALGGQPPFQAFPQARHSTRYYALDAEAQLLDMHRVYYYLQSGRWFRQVSSVGTFSLGGYKYNVTTRFAKQILEITFDCATHKLICLPEKGTTAFHLDIKGWTKTALMGNSLALPINAAYPTGASLSLS